MTFIYELERLQNYFSEIEHAGKYLWDKGVASMKAKTKKTF